MKRSAVLGVALVASAAMAGEDLTFEDRVRAQEAIERVYHRHQIGAPESFDALMPPPVIEEKVRKYLDETAALDKFWKTKITDEMLTRELERMARGTKMPDRLLELYAALGNDQLLIKECLARPALVDRLAHNFYGTEAGWDDWFTRARAEVDGLAVRSVSGSRGHPPVPQVACGAGDAWDNASLDDVPDPRSAYTQVWTGTKVLIWGGISNAVLLRDGWLYDPATDVWLAMSQAGAPSARDNHTAVWTGTKMIVWGGDDASASGINTGGRYDPATDSWAATSTNLAPAGRRYHSAVWAGDRMVIWGGYSFVAQGTVSSGGRYDPVQNSWTATNLVGAPSHRLGATSVWTGSRVLIWGGYDEFGVGPGGRYDLVTDTWTPIATINEPVWRVHHTGVWTGSAMIVWGGIGTNGGYLATGGRYDPATDVWSSVSTAGAPAARRWHTAVWTGSRMIVWGGQVDVTFAGVDTGGRYDPVTDVWTATSVTGAPAPRFLHGAVWAGNLMVVWGGQGGSTFTNTGGRYDPATDSWTPTSTGGLPAARYRHTGVWTGNAMIVWGGMGFTGRLQNGGRYDLVTDTWSPTAMAGAPSARDVHTAVWTGTEMLVWGGDSGGGLFETGGRYNVATDSWAPIALVGAPSARYRHTAVWTGSSMLVWGGQVGAFTNTGGRYDPAANSWTPITASGAPSARSFHTAVWTGDRMIVWGGTDGGRLNTGGRYDPLSDSWTPTSTTNAPAGRYLHTGVWTGTRLIVWGGNNFATGVLNTGATYDAVNDTWTPTTTAGAASIRQEHSAVWTGARMIVWGGNAGAGPAPGGAIYDPAANTWSAMQTGGSPSGRSNYAAAWTGSVLVVEGGNDGNVALSSGGRYVLGGAVDDDGDGLTECQGDCNDAAPGMHPGAAEACNGADDDCDGVVDESLARPIYPDVDGDGYGQSAVTQTTCASPSGWVAVPGDCNDASSAVHPGATEVCNSADDDCNAQIDDDAAGTDSDGDLVHNACDDCRFTSNATQSDFDHDGQGDACDLDDGLIYVYAARKDFREWQAEPGFSSWNDYRGSLAVLRATGTYTQLPGSNPLAARDCALLAPEVADPLVPGVGETAFHLVAGVAGGVESGLGTDSSDVPRSNTNPCP